MSDRILSPLEYAEVVKLLLGNVSGDRAILGDGSAKVSYKGQVFGARELIKEAIEIARDNDMLSSMVHDLYESSDAYRAGLREGRLGLLTSLKISDIELTELKRILLPFGYLRRFSERFVANLVIWDKTLRWVHDSTYDDGTSIAKDLIELQKVLRRFVDNLTPEGEYYHGDDYQRSKSAKRPVHDGDVQAHGRP